MDKKLRNLLGLSNLEEKVITVLSTQRLNISDISRKVKAPVTTLNYIVYKLQKRGLLKTIDYGKRKLWTIADTVLLRKQFITIAELFNNEKENGITNIPISTSTGIEIYRGTKSLYRLWKKLISSSKEGRLYAIQPDKSFNSAVTHIIKELSYTTLVDINKEIKENKIIVDALVHEHTADTLPKTILSTGYNPVEFLDSFKGRLAATAKLPPTFMDVSAEIYLHNKTVTIIHWDDEVAISITNKDTVTFFKEMFNSVKFFSETYNQTEKIAKKVSEIKTNNNT